MTVMTCDEPNCNSNQFNIVRNPSMVMPDTVYYTFICRECYSTCSSPISGVQLADA